MKAVLLGTALSLISGLAAQAQSEPLHSTLEELASRAYRVNIIASVISGDSETVWNMELTEVTISGRAVRVELAGSNITVSAQFTPFREDDGSILLVAEGQTVVRHSNDDPESYEIVDSMPIDLGEPVLFFPLGLSLEGESEETLSIRLEIRIVPYES